MIILNRIIIHSDCNSFYASVECLYHPELRDKPVAVVGDVEQRHGIYCEEIRCNYRRGHMASKTKMPGASDSSGTI